MINSNTQEFYLFGATDYERTNFDIDSGGSKEVNLKLIWISDHVIVYEPAQNSVECTKDSGKDLM